MWFEINNLIVMVIMLHFLFSSHYFQNTFTINLANLLVPLSIWTLLHLPHHIPSYWLWNLSAQGSSLQKWLITSLKGGLPSTKRPVLVAWNGSNTSPSNLRTQMSTSKSLIVVIQSSPLSTTPRLVADSFCNLTGVCGTDVHSLRSALFPTDYPCCAGHE